MSAYIYRVTAHRVKLTDGTEANVAIYAYKPWGGLDADRKNKRAALLSGCFASDRIKEITGRIVLGRKDESGKVVVYAAFNENEKANVYENPRGWRTFYDDSNLGVPGKLPIVEGVYVAQ